MKDEFNDGVVLSDKVKQIIKHYDNLEHYQAEQQRRNCVSYDEDNLENRLYNESDTVEFTAERKAELDALKKALDDLSSEDLKIIQDNFFYVGKKPSYTELAKECGITRQVYTRKLNRVLAKLKKLVENYLNNP